MTAPDRTTADRRSMIAQERYRSGLEPPPGGIGPATP